MNQHDLKYLYNLIYASIEGHITPEQFQALKEILRDNPQAVAHYIDFMSILCKIRSSEHFNAKSQEDLFNKQLWGMLSQHEKSAPTVHLLNETPDDVYVQLRRYDTARRKISLSTMVSFAAVAAAVLFVVSFALFVPKPGRFEVATLADSMGAQWASQAGPIQPGERLYADGKLLVLREGLVQLQFDTNARVVVEAPAEFQILAEDRIGLQLGKIYAIVPKEAAGFSVYTQNGKVIDFGTEFGVQANQANETLLHVIKGKTLLIAGGQSDKKNSVEVSAGGAKRVSGISGVISDIRCNESLFARTINSSSHTVWRGQPAINLADLVGGGNGFGTGNQDYGIEIETGILSQEPLDVNGYGLRNKKTWTSYRSITQIPGIDGIFIPDGKPEPTIVSSQGHRFENCPDTGSFWCAPIINGSKTFDGKFNLSVNDVLYGTTDNPAIFMHANIGITYDLQVFRNLLPEDVLPTRFSALVVAPKIPYSNVTSHFDVWVLVDGKVCYSKKGMSSPQSVPVEIALSKQDRFLSLVVTESNDKTNAYDWCFFCRPELTLETK